MAEAATVAWAVNLLFGALAREPNEAQIEAYIETLADRTDWQVRRATRELLSVVRQWPVTAAELRDAAGRYDRTHEDEMARRQRERDTLRLTHQRRESPEKASERMEANRKAMRLELLRLAAGDEPIASWAKAMQTRLDGARDPMEVLTGVTKPPPRPDRHTNDEIVEAIAHDAVTTGGNRET